MKTLITTLVATLALSGGFAFAGDGCCGADKAKEVKKVAKTDGCCGDEAATKKVVKKADDCKTVCSDKNATAEDCEKACGDKAAKKVAKKSE